MANRYGTEGNDVLDGTFMTDNIAGYGGDDILRGFAGGDVLWGGVDNDWMDGGAGGNALYGLSGFDTASYELATSGVLIRPEGASCQNGTLDPPRSSALHAHPPAPPQPRPAQNPADRRRTVTNNQITA